MRFAFIAVLAAQVALAQEPPPQTSSAPNIRDVMLARDYGMGGAYRAHGLGTESVTGNPAAITLYKRYQLELGGAWDITNKFAFGTIAVADSQTSQLGAGLAYDLVSFGQGETRRVAHLNTLALALPLADFLHIGFGVRNIIETGYREANAITLDAGLLIAPMQGLSIGFSGHNLIDTRNPDMTPWFTGAVAYSAGVFTVAFDMKADFGVADAVKLAYAVGGEYIAAEGLPLRIGYQYDGISNAHFVSAGIGLMAESGGIDFAYRHEIGGLEGRMFALTLKIFVH